MAENLIKLDRYAFRGSIPDGSFMKSGYAIWKEGLAGQRANPFAVKQGETYASRMFDIKSTHSLASYQQFIEYLQKIKQKEEKKEHALIDFEIAKQLRIRPNSPTLKAAQRAAEEGKFGLAYTFLLKSDEEFEDFLQERQKPEFNYSHSNAFWRAEFSTFLAKKISEWLESLEDGIEGNELELTIEDLVEGWINELTDGAEGLSEQSLYLLRNSVFGELKHLFEKYGLLYKNKTKLSGRKVRAHLNKKKYATTKKGENRSIKNQAESFAEDIGVAFLGISQELAQRGKQGTKGIAFNTGAIKKEIAKTSTGKKAKVSIKADVVSYVVADITFNTQQIIDDLTQIAENEIEQAMSYTEQQLLTIKKEKGTRIFRVATNVKGYRSKNDLRIEKEGTFLQRTQNLRKLMLSSGMPENSMEKLIFMLANTVSGCIAENRIQNIQDYIAAVCVAWMWDDYTDLMSVSESPEGIEQVRMFSSGGFYYSASQIMEQAIANLQQDAAEKGEQFVVVDITPPTFNADSFYSGLIDKHPIQPGEPIEKQQDTLSKRWLDMRDNVMAKGKIGIKLNQKMLEDLIGDLEGIIEI